MPLSGGTIPDHNIPVPKAPQPVPTGQKASAPGLRMRLSAVKGLTDSSLLKVPFYFPCPPIEEWTHSGTYNHNDYDTVNAGQFSRRGGKQLKTWSFDSLIPDDQSVSWIVFKRYQGKAAVQKALEALRDSGTAFRFLATHNLATGDPELDLTATLRGIDVTERSGEPDARYVTFQFSEYRDPIVVRNANASSQRSPGEVQGGTTTSRTGNSSGKDWPVTIELRSDNKYSGITTRGEELSLQVIAKYVYGDAGAVPTIRTKIKPPISDWGASTPLIQYPTFRKGGKIVCPEVKGIRGD